MSMIETELELIGAETLGDNYKFYFPVNSPDQELSFNAFLEDLKEIGCTVYRDQLGLWKTYRDNVSIVESFIKENDAGRFINKFLETLKANGEETACLSINGKGKLISLENFRRSFG